MSTSTGPGHPRPLPLPLSEQTLGSLPAAVAPPGYDRSALTPSVVHIGVGGFHRSHQAAYFDELARTGETGWGVVGVGLHRAEISEVLDAQDGLYVLVERDGGGDSARVVGVVRDHVHAPGSEGEVLDLLTDGRTRLVTMTITGGGYLVDPATGRFDAEGDGVRDDLAHPHQPRTVFGYLVEALDRRRRAGVPPFSVLSCDNVPRNGETARTAVVSFARLRDPGLAGWIEANVAFPNSMVDRITPETTPGDRDEIAGATGVDDRWPVLAESFSQWVVEDAFGDARPPLDRVGVQFVEDVTPYETMKKRLLNGGHCALGYVGLLAGGETSAEVMGDGVLRAFVDRLMADEVAPLLPAVPGVDLDAYRETLLERFGNPRIGDRLERLARRGSVKLPGYVLPSVTDALTADRPHAMLDLVVAAWIAVLGGRDAQGREISVSDPQQDRLLPLAREAGDDPARFLAASGVFGDLAADDRFVAGVRAAARSLAEHGPRGAAERLVGDRSVAA